MPLIADERAIGQIQQLPESPELEVPEESPSLSETFGAAFRQENTLVSWASNNLSLSGDTEPLDGYDSLDDIDGYEMFAENFIESNNPGMTSRIKQQIDQEQTDKQTLAASGGVGFVAQVAAGLSDPVYWPLMAIPGGAAIRASKTVGQAGRRVAAIGGVSEIPAEAAKQYTQETRTVEESLAVIAGATVLSGILGASIKGLTKQTHDQIAKKLDDVMGADEPEIVPGNMLSIGAAKTKELTLEELELVSAGGIEKLGVSPVLRTSTSPSVATRQVANSMMETPFVTKGNVEGIATAPEGGAAETRIKLWNAGLAQGIQKIDELYTKYRGGQKATKRILNDYVMRNRAGALTAKEFRESVGRSARRGDVSDIPEVQEASEFFRKNVFDPMKDAAIKEKLLPPDVDVSTATSYLTRVYNTTKMAARRPEWDAIVEGWLGRIRDRAVADIDARTAAGKKAAASMIEQADMSERMIKEVANDITNNIMGNASGRVPYEIISNVRGPLKERTFNIPDELIEEFLESDIDLVARQYTRTMAPDIELNRMFGSATLDDQVEEIASSYKPLIDKAKTEKARIKLKSKMESDIRDTEAMRDMLRGTYRVPENPDAFFIRAGRTLRDVNFMRMLGGMTISAIPDLARPIAVNGLAPVAKGLKALALSPKTFKMAKAEAKRNAVGLDMVINSRVSSMAEITDIYNRTTPFERGLRAMSDVFSKLTLMSQWNASLKQFVGVVTQDRIIAESIKLASGKASKNSIRRLAASGIDKELASRISSQFAKHGDDGDLKLSNGHLWDDKEAMESLAAAVLKDTDRAIVTPGKGEKPLWTSSETGKMVFQFKTFAASAHQKILIADLQHRDAQALSGFLMSVALGSAVYGIKETLAGREISDDPSKIIVESLDRSGAFGYFWDANNIVEKMTRGEVGINKLVGAPPMSRYQSRNILGALLGPSVGTVQDITQITGAAATGEFTASDIRKIRKLMPMQNLFYMRQLLNSLEEDVTDSLGVEQ